MYISSAPYCTGSYCRYDNLQIKIWKSEYLHLGIAQDPKNKRMGNTNCVSVMSNKFSFGPKIDDNFLHVRPKETWRQAHNSYQLSKFADTWISCFSLKEKLSQCHFLRTEEGRHLGKEGKCSFMAKNSWKSRL